MKVLILGASGMLGSTLMRVLYHNQVDVYGTVRSVYPELSDRYDERIISNVRSITQFEKVIREVRPDILINAIGIIKQLGSDVSDDEFLSINAVFPHTLVQVCNELPYPCKVIHYSTDCVFDGKSTTPYTESSMCTAHDIYGVSKYLGELHNTNALTIRTSIIGHEYKNHVSLIDWFLRQHDMVCGYTNVMWNGLPVVEHARILMEYVFPNINRLSGVYQVSGIPISKYILLDFVKHIYGHDCELVKHHDIIEYKVLDCSRFTNVTGYIPRLWYDLIIDMYTDYTETHVHTGV